MKRLVLVLSVALAISASADDEARPRTVTLDVKDAEARVILRSMQKQCGIRNLIIDADVQASGTFYFREVPCGKALSVALRTMGLAGQIHPNSLITVERRR